MRILFVDDNSIIRSTFGDALRQKGHDVVIAIDGTDGLYKYQQGQFDLIISDVNMPIKSGIWLVEQIRKYNEEIPVIGFSGCINSNEVKEMYEAGATEIYAKTAFHELCMGHGI